MKTSAVLFVFLLFVIPSIAQETIVTSSRWTDMGEHETGVHKYISFNILGKEVAIEATDSTVFEGDITTRCRYRLSNLSDKEVVVSRIYITLYSGDEKYDTYVRKKTVRLMPYENHYGAFLTPELRKAKKMVMRASMYIRAKSEG